MKKISICSFLFCFLISCSSDSDLYVSDNNNNAGSQKADKPYLPANNANPFDNFGKKYYEALTSYQHQNRVPSSTLELNEQIMFISEQFEKEHINCKRIIAKNSGGQVITLSDMQGHVIQVVRKSFMEEPAKAVLINFLEEVTSKRQDSFSSIYDFVVSYEKKVLKNSELNESDRKAILAITSISRYSFYSDANRKDRDWEKSAGNHFISSGAENMSVISIITLMSKII